MEAIRLPADGALFSACGKYRWYLGRVIPDAQAEGSVLAFIPVNPSVAGEIKNDPSVRKMMGFAQRNGAARIMVWNPFAMVATDVRELRSAIDPIGPENMAHLDAVIAEATILIPCWGNRGKLHKRLHPHLDRVRDILFASGKPVQALGITKSGDPTHPLMLGYHTPLMDWADPNQRMG